MQDPEQEQTWEREQYTLCACGCGHGCDCDRDCHHEYIPVFTHVPLSLPGHFQIPTGPRIIRNPPDHPQSVIRLWGVSRGAAAPPRGDQ